MTDPVDGPEPSDPTKCSGDEGFCPEHGFHRHSLKQPAVPSASADVDLRERIAAALTAEWHRRAKHRIVASPEEHSAAMTDAVLAALPAPADRAAVLREAADALDASDRLRDLTDDHMLDINAAANELRRMADEAQQAGEAAHRPRRGDVFERWLKAQRDAAADYPEAYQAADGLLDLYRLHADTGTLLDQHVCEGQAVGDCDCLEQPADEARQADTTGEA